MKVELPCEVVKDLLPSYIDEVASPYTTSLVAEHLNECEACRHIYNGMKEEESKRGQSKMQDEKEFGAEEDKRLFKKINKKINKKVRIVGGLGIIGIFLAVCLTQILFNDPLKVVSPTAVSVSAHVYPLQTLVTGTTKEQPAEGIISKGETKDGDELYTISVPDMSNTEITISKGVIDDGGYMTYIAWQSPYVLKDIKREEKTVDGQEIIYVTGFKTTLLNNESTGGECIMPELEFRKIDKVVYVGEDGQEQVLWQNDGNEAK